jgi:predicted tellurium resistance membrane protein TerC
MQTAGVVGIAYLTWAIGQFFDKKKATSYVKAFASYILGMISFMVIAMLLGTSIDLIIKL